MRKLLYVALLVPSLAIAAPVSVDFRQVGIVELCEAVLKGMLQKDYVISPDVLADNRKITISLKNQEKPAVLDVLVKVMHGQGIELVERSGIYYVDKPVQSGSIAADPAAQAAIPDLSALKASSDQAHDNIEIKPLEFRTYRPKHRPTVQLAKVAKFAGANVADIGESLDVLVYSATDTVDLDRVEKLLTGVDTPPAAVTIRAALIEYSESSDNSRSFSAALDILSGKLGVIYKAGSALANSVSYSGKTLQAAVSAIQGDSRFHYLAEPTIRVLDGEKARLVVGSDVPVRGNSTVDKNGTTIQAVDYRTSGVQITVEPQIKERTITLRIGQEISNFGQTTTSNIDSPTLFKRQAETVLDAKRGDLIVMAGMDEDKKTSSSSGFTWLPAFLRSNSETKTKSQILLLLEVVDG